LPRNALGIYTPPSGTLAVTNTAISSTSYNNFVNDLASALTGSVGKVEAAEAEHAAHVEQLVRDQDERYGRIVRLEEQLGATRQQPDRIEKKLDSLGAR